MYCKNFPKFFFFKKCVSTKFNDDLHNSIKMPVHAQINGKQEVLSLQKLVHLDFFLNIKTGSNGFLLIKRELR